MHFAKLENIFLLAFFVGYLGLLWLERIIAAKKIKKIATPEKYLLLTKNLPKNRNKVKNILIGCSLIFFTLGLMDFKAGEEETSVHGKNSDIVILLDISLSMKSKDVLPTRLNRAKREIESLLEVLNGERVALMAFANSAITVLPLTKDYQAISNLLRKINTTWVSTQGTNLTIALQLAEELFKRTKRKNNQFVIIYSDGENHENLSIKAAKKLANSGVQIFSVGIGTKEGIELSLTEELKKNLFLDNEPKEKIITKLETKNLENIAKTGNGFLVLPHYEIFSFKRISDQIKEVGFNRMELDKISSKKSHYHYFILVVLFLLYSELFLKKRKEIK